MLTRSLRVNRAARVGLSSSALLPLQRKAPSQGRRRLRKVMRGCGGQSPAGWIYSASAFAQAISRRRVRNRATAWLCNWQTRDSLTSITAPISRRFMPRS